MCFPLFFLDNFFSSSLSFSFSTAATAVCCFAILAIVSCLLLMSQGHQKEEIHSLLVSIGILLPVAGLVLFGFALSLVEQAPPGSKPISSQLRFSGSALGASLLIFFAAGLYAAAGIGGNSFYSATFILLLKMSPHLAVPLAHFTTFGMSIGSFAFLVSSRHPFADRPIIDYLLCLVLESFTLLGTVFGDIESGVSRCCVDCSFGGCAYHYSLENDGTSSRNAEERNHCRPRRCVCSTDRNRNYFRGAGGKARHSDRENFAPRSFLSVAVWAAMSLFIIFRGSDFNCPSVIGLYCGSWQHGIHLGALILFLVIASGAELLLVRRRHAHK